ncbi:MAG: efflux RND transporter periplasmic adaptor subunit [Xanthomonadales bacterium]|nr:efflux RND transporter periplasmic adaptor subunit [Xanthomonadales bacterium]
MKQIWLIVAVALATAGCERSEPQVEEQLRPVRTMVVPEASGARQRTFSGVSSSTQESRLSFKVAGTVTEIPVQVGDELEANALVARLDASPYQLQAQQAEAALRQAEAAARNAAANYERVKGLYENSNASRNDLDAARASAESAQAQVRAAQKALELARLNVSYTRLTVDRNCSVASVEVERNENVSSGTPIAIVNCGAGLEIGLDIPEGLIAGLSQGMPARIAFSAVPGRSFPGVVSEVGVATSANAPTFPVTVRVSETDPALRAGLAAEVTFEFRANDRGTQILPVAAVAHDPGGSFVYLAVPGEAGEAIVTRRPVTLGELTESGIEVREGLNPGERVITAGVSVIRDGQRVLLPEG